MDIQTKYKAYNASWAKFLGVHGLLLTGSLAITW